MSTLQITFVSESAGYSNSFGWYNSRTGEAGIIFINTNDDGPNAGISAGTTTTIEAEQSDIDAGYIGFFLIPNGAGRYGTGENSALSGPLSFEKKPNGDGQILDADGHKLRGAQSEIIFSDRALNKKNVDYTAGDDDSILGRIAFEDLVRKSDRDYNDLVVDVQIVNTNRPPVVNDQSFAIAENSAADTLVGQIAASDPDAGQALSYAIVAGNESGAFAIDAATGAITVADTSKLDFEDPALSSYELTVQVTDNGTGALRDTAIVSIAVTDALPIVGTQGNDSLVGTNGDDVLIGDLGNDLLRGGADNDVLNGGVVADFQSDVGFRDTDRADYSTASSGVNVNLASGIAQDGDDGIDTLIGVEGVIGSAYDDVLTGGSDAFVEFFRGGAGNDTIDGGNWNDRAEYMDATGGIAVNLAALAPNMGTVTGDASVGSDTLKNVEIVYGTDFADSYVATGFSSASQPGGLLSTFNAFEGRAGDDTIVGNGSTRVEFTGATSGIEVSLATGIATGDASVGRDTFTGVNSVRGTQYADTLLGGNPLLNGFESFEGRAGDDYIDGGQGFDLAVYAFDGPITTGITVDLAAGTVAGDPVLTGTDTLRGIEGIRGSHLNDVYVATGFSASSVNAGSSGIYNEFEGMAGNDSITGNGITRIIYTAAREGVSVDLAAGTAVGGASVGTDTLLSGIWAVRGSNFNDVLVGSATGEYFEGRAGNDSIDGGGGFDAAAYDVGASGGGTFVANAAGGFSATAAGLGTDTLSNIGQVTGTNFGDLFDGSAALIGYSFFALGGNDTLIGSQGGDFLNGGTGDDTLSGGAGNDFLDGGAGNDVIDGGDGFDQTHYEFGPTSGGSFVANSLGVITASAGGSGTDVLTSIEWITGTSFGDFFDASAAADSYSFDGYVGDDTLIGSQGDDQLRGSDGNDVLVGGAGSDYMDGGSGFDRADYSSAFGAVNVDLSSGATSDGMGGLDTLFSIEAVSGSAFNDTLIGDWLDNRLEGGMGNDLLRGGEGADYIDGGLGVDRIDYDSPWEGTDTVAGFEAVPGGDVIDIADLLQNWTGYAGGAGGPLSNFVRLGALGLDAQLEINVGPGLWQPLATLPGGGGLSLNTLVANGNLFTGAVSGITLIGTPGNDSLIGTAGDDTILADLGNDFLRGGGGNDLLDGGVVADLQSDVGWRDSDRVDYSTAFMGVDVNLATGVALDGEGGVDTLIGIEAVTGSPFNDLLTGTSTFSENFLGGAGNDTIQGGGGFDRSDYQNATAGVTIIVGGFGGFATNSGTASGNASVGFDTLLDVEQFTGSEFDDSFSIGLFSTNSLPGGFFNNTNAFEGRGGDDVITGNGATRVEYTSAAGAVTVDLAARTATGDASVGNDTFTGGVVEVRGSSFADMLLGGNPASNGLETFDGRGGNDVIDGKQGWDRADYAFNGPVSVGITVHLAAGTVTGDATLVGTDELHSVEAVRGTHLADLYDASGFSDLSANAGSSGMLNEFQGMAGDDTIIGNGSTRIAFGLAREGVSVDLQAGTVTGGASVGNDTIVGGVFDVRGSNFDDVLVGSLGNELLFGNSGNDLLRGGQGFDFLDGGAGSDRFDFDSLLDAGDSINFFAAGMGGDVLDIADLMISSTSYPGGPFTDYVSIFSMGSDALLQVDPDGTGIQGWQTVATLIGRAGLTLDFLASNGNLEVGPGGGGGGVTLIGTPDNDNLFGSPGDDTLVGLQGNDFLVGFGGNDLLDGGIVADVQSDAGFRDTDRVDYSAASGSVTVSLATGQATGADGNDTLIGIESVNGSMFNDHFTGSDTTFSENFHGGGGDDQIHGGGGFDRAEYHSAAGVWDPMLATLVGVTINVGGFGGFASAEAMVGGDFFTVGFDTLSNVEQFTGSDWADTYSVGWFMSDALPGGVLTSFNAFDGRGGDDTVFGNGNTRVDYTNATGAVTVDFSMGQAWGDASVGIDTLFSVNQVRATSFNDTLLGSTFFVNETFDGRGGNDWIDGRGGFDRADYAFNGPATSGITVDLDLGVVTGDPVFTGTDDLRSIESIRGTHLADTYDATGFSSFSVNAGSSGTLNEFEGMAGDDFVIGNGNTRLTFSLAREGVMVDLQGGTVVGGASVGTDTISGVNTMRGSNFDDVLMGTNHGTTTAQIYEGRAGNDTFSGRGGFDQAVYSSESTQMGITVDMDAINAFTGTVVGDAGIGTDTLIDIVSVIGTFFNDYYDATGYNSTVSTLGTFNEFEGGFGDDTVIGNGNTRISYSTAGSGVSVDLGLGTAFGSASGSDSLSGVNAVRGSNFDDFMTGSAANETFEGRGGNDAINGGDGIDLVRFDFAATGGGTFIANASGGFSAAAIGQGSDALSGIESIRGTNFGDQFDGSAAVLGYTFDARGGNDTLIGSQGNDTLLGGDGNDLLRGGPGGDSMDGGAGADTFDFDRLDEAGDTVAGFAAVPSGDVLDIADLLFNWTSYAGGAGGPLSDFVRFEPTGPNTQLQIDRDGFAGPESWQGLATMQGHSSLDLATLLTNGNLDILI